MDFTGEASFAGGYVIPDSAAGSEGFESWGPNFSDQAVWATEDDYKAWNTGPFCENPSNSSKEGGRHSQNQSGSEPPSKKSRNVRDSDAHVIVTSSSEAIGKMFFKTKFFSKFRTGVCPNITNRNFAHGIEELRKPPPNWQEIVAAHESERGVMVEMREEHQIPILSSPDLHGESQRSSEGRHCKKFYTEEECPYGDSCTSLHDEQSRSRESLAITVTPTVGGFGNNATEANQKPSNWKTIICNKWETIGYCPSGSKCHFAHGVAELNKFGGGPAETEGKDYLSVPPDSKQGGVPLRATESTLSSTVPALDTDVYHVGQGVQVQTPTGIVERPGQRFKWKGPDKISKIYADWIDDLQ